MTDQIQTDLAKRAQAGDASALGVLWRRHRRWLAAILLAHMPERADLDDLLQEVALSICEHIRELREPVKLLPWMRSIARNVAHSAVRRHTSRRGRLHSLNHGGDEPLDPSSLPEQGACGTADRVLELARRLDPDYREPLLLRCVRGLSQRAIAERLDLPETTVETRLARARRLLRNEMEREERAVPVRRERAASPNTRESAGF